MMTSWVKAISVSEEPAAMMVSPANCPADVKLVREIRPACQAVSPQAIAFMPNVKLTGK